LADSEQIFHCPVEDCNFKSCRHCGEESHIPLRCDEVESRHQAKGRVRVEEAAAAAVIRNCPRCKKAVIKSDGCNRITCACHCKFCYCCRKEISGYDHFCNTPFCQHLNRSDCGGKCPLYSKDLDAEDAKAAREAAEAEAAKVQAEIVDDVVPRRKDWGSVRRATLNPERVTDNAVSATGEGGSRRRGDWGSSRGAPPSIDRAANDVTGRRSATAEAIAIAQLAGLTNTDLGATRGRARRSFARRGRRRFHRQEANQREVLVDFQRVFGDA
jgi:hypothetical protein